MLMTLEPVLSVHARSALMTVTSAPSYEDSHSLVLTVVSRHQCYVSVFKLEELRLRVGRAELQLTADPGAPSLQCPCFTCGRNWYGLVRAVISIHTQRA